MILARVSREDFLEEVPSELGSENREDLGQGTLGRGNCKCKLPEAGANVDGLERARVLTRMAGMG